MITINEISLRSVKIKIILDNGNFVPEHGTGFFVNYKNKMFIISNRHVLEGKYKDTLVHTGTKVQVEALVKNDFMPNLRSASKVFDLYNEEGIPNFKNIEDYDVSVLEVTGKYKNNEDPATGRFIGFSVYEITEDAELKLSVMDQVFIIGFPLNELGSPNQYPIYKSGFIASEPELNKDGYFLVDAKSKPGMSGSPVVTERTVNNMKTAQTSDGVSISSVPVKKYSLIGVYSGRIIDEKTNFGNKEDREFKAELGKVWPIKECLLPILESFFQ